MSTASSNHCIGSTPCARATCRSAARSLVRVCSMSVAAAVCLTETLARAGATVTGIDLAPTMVETARLHALESGLDIDYRLESAEALLIAHTGKFDVVTCMEMLEHVPDPGATVAVLANLVRPGGDIFISTINRNLKSFALAIIGAEYVANLVPRGTHEYERLLKPSEIARFARAASLEVADIAGLQLRPGALAVLAHQRSLGQLPHASETQRRMTPHPRRIVRPRRNAARYRARHVRGAERAARRGGSRATAVRPGALPGFARRTRAHAPRVRHAATRRP